MQILSRLNVAEAFEMFLQTKYVGQRRFSLEGGESLIPLLDAVLTEAADAPLDEAVLGISAQGQLNVLANIVGKSYAQIFQEFGEHGPAQLARVRRREVPPGRVGRVHRERRPRSPPRWWPTPLTWRRSTPCSRGSSGPSRTSSTWASPVSRCSP